MKGELLEGKRLITAFREQANPPEDALLEASALVRRLSINREFAFHWPGKESDVDAYEQEVLKELIRDSRRVMRRLRKLVKQTAGRRITLNTKTVIISKKPALSLGNVIPPLLMEQSDELVDELLDQGWVEPADYTIHAGPLHVLP